jgi:NAD(P)-dependent dehydrogenase (short-subunit alcohol dehydrogenase family)
MTGNEGRVAVVTGGASGIGRATAEQLLAEGASVVVGDIDEAALSWASDQPRARTLVCDVTREADNQRLVETAVAEFGGLDSAILNAGLAALGSLDTLPLEDFERAIDVNLRGVVLGLRAAIPALSASPAGSVVVTASASGIGGDPGMWAYNAAKGGAVNLTRGAAVDLGHRGIRVNCVCPGPIHTGMTSFIRDMAPAQYDEMRRRIPLQRWGEPGDVGAVICFLASPAAGFVTGAIVPVDGGVTSSTGQFLPPERV